MGKIQKNSLTFLYFIGKNGMKSKRDFLQFYNVEFLFESMKKYNGMDASLDMNGEIAITDEGGNEIWKGFACAIPEFRSGLNNISST